MEQDAIGQLKELKKQREALNTKLQGLQLSRSAQIVRSENIVDFKRLLADVKKPDEAFTIADKEGFEEGISTLEQKLRDNAIRMKVRDMPPTIISCIDFDTVRGEWTVYDLNGKRVYTSMPA